jgi:hypothetical protein
VTLEADAHIVKFRVLLVDDEEAHETEKLAPLRRDPLVDLVVADSREEARAASTGGYFHLALVDLQLDAEDDRNIDGQLFLRELQEGRPTCRRILLTRTAGEHHKAIFELANPDGPMIHGALDKSDFGRDWVRWIKARAAHWNRTRLYVHELAVLRLALGKAVSGRGVFGDEAPIMTDDELMEVISKLLGDQHTSDMNGAEPPEVLPIRQREEVRLAPLPGPQGESSAGVVLARVEFGGALGSQTWVVKVAERADCKQESSRYESFARFRISPQRRAELLGVWLGDTIGAAAYAFAGRSPDDIGDLEAMFTARDERAIDVVKALFGSEVDDLWQPVEEVEDAPFPSDLGAYFFDAYKLDAKSVGGEVESYVRNHEAQLGIGVINETMRLTGSGRMVALPNARFLGGPNVRTSYRSGLIHGDLNARNILVGDENSVRLIDFRHARVGALAADFAAIESSVRLAAAMEDANHIENVFSVERATLTAGWSERRRDEAVARLPYWGKVSVGIAECGRKRATPFAKREYLAACLLYAFRLFRVNDLGAEKHLRLVPWIAALCGALDV